MATNHLHMTREDILQCRDSRITFCYWRDVLRCKVRDIELERMMYPDVRSWRWFVSATLNKGRFEFTNEELIQYITRDVHILRGIMRLKGAFQLREDYTAPNSVVRAGLIIHGL